MINIDSNLKSNIALVGKTNIIFSPINYTKTVSIGILVGAGSITEIHPSSLGYSHFLEHMIFKGTYKLDFEKLNKEFEKLGAYVNAFTGKYYTLFYVHCLAEFANQCLELLLHIVFESTLPIKEIEKEKKVVLEEIHTYKDSPEDYIQEEFYSHTFKKSFLGSPILGTKQTIEAISYSSLWQYYKQYYTPENSLISIAGHFNQSQISQIVEKFFKQTIISAHHFNIKSPVEFYAGHQTYYKAEIEQAHLCMGINTQNIPVSKHVLKLFNIILGGMSSSRLYLSVREQKALCYTIDSTLYTDPNTGFINIFASTQAPQIKELLGTVLEELTSFTKNPISAEELLIAKNQTKSRIAFRQESISQTMMKVASQVFFYGKILSDDMIMDKIEHIQLQDFEPIYNALSSNHSLHILMPAEFKNKTK